MIAVEMLIEVLTERFGAISTNLPKQLESIDSRESIKTFGILSNFHILEHKKNPYCFSQRPQRSLR